MLQPMVVSRIDTKSEFALRLAAALDTVKECPRDRGRRQWIAREFAVSVETARKWLEGLAIPDQTNLSRLSARTGVSPAWLFAANGNRIADGSADPYSDKLAGMWDQLDDEAKKQILSFATVRIAKLPDDDDEKKSRLKFESGRALVRE